MISDALELQIDPGQRPVVAARVDGYDQSGLIQNPSVFRPGRRPPVVPVFLFRNHFLLPFARLLSIYSYFWRRGRAAQAPSSSLNFFNIHVEF